MRYSAVLTRYLNSCTQSCYCAPTIWVFAPAGRQRRSAGPLRPAVPGRAAVPIASVTATQLGEHLGLTRQRIGVLADIEHVIERLPNGRFNQDQSRLKYLAHLRSPERRSARSEAAAKHAEARLSAP